MKQKRLLLLVVVLGTVLSLPAMMPQERREYLDRFVDTLPAVPAFASWLESTGELPPV
jgi:hypothetical protein